MPPTTREMYRHGLMQARHTVMLSAAERRAARDCHRETARLQLNRLHRAYLLGLARGMGRGGAR